MSMINLRQRGVGYATREEILASVEAEIQAARDVANGASDEEIIPWETMDLATGRERGDSYRMATEEGLINPIMMPSGLKKWVAVANALL